MTETLFVALSLLVSFLVVLPIMQEKSGKRQRGAYGVNNYAAELAEQKGNIYQAIKEIEFDFEMGKLSQEDFDELRQQYKQEAVGLLKKIDQVTSSGPRKSGRKNKQGGPSSSNIQASVKFCWICGTGITDDDQFCASCGTNLQNT